MKHDMLVYIMNKECEIQHMQQEKNELKETIRIKNEEIAKARNGCKKLREENDLLKAKLATTNTGSDTLKDVNETNRMLRKHVANLDATNTNLRTALEKANQEHEQTLAELDDTKNCLFEAEEQIKRMQREYYDVDIRYEKAKAKICELDEQLQGRRKQNNELKRLCETYDKEAEDFKKEIRQIENQRDIVRDARKADRSGLRLCTARGKKGYFHRFITEQNVIDMRMMTKDHTVEWDGGHLFVTGCAGGYTGDVVTTVCNYALVELENGHIIKVEPKDICFITEE